MEQAGQLEHHVGFFSDPEGWVSIAFVIFVLLFGSKLWRALVGILDKRTETIRAELSEAADLKAEAERMLANARRQREEALAMAKKILDNAKIEAAELTQAAREEAQVVAQRRERMTLDRIAAAEKAALTDVRNAAADVASLAAQKAIADTLSGTADVALIDRAIQELPKAFAPNKAA